MGLAYELLARGYLPRELPPNFSSRSFASAVNNNANMIADFATIAKRPPQGRDVELAPFNLARFGTLQRRLGIPNPVPHLVLCHEFENEWSALDAHYRKSNLSLTRPRNTYAFEPRAVERTHDHTELPRLRAEKRAGFRYILRADISRFYQSIYTHTIPWALAGRGRAKATRGKGVPGDALDKWIRVSQSAQTVGIPIGPDTSLLVAEAILTSIDERLVKSVPGLRGFRYLDDYEFQFATLAQAEAVLGQLQEALATFELALNPSKTRILELPHELERPWTRLLTRTRVASSKKKFDGAKAVDYFGLAFELSRQYPNEPVLSFAVSQLVNRKLSRYGWPTVVSLLLQCASAESGVIWAVLQILFAHRRYGLDKDVLKAGLELQIVQHASRRQASEVAWALWAAVGLDIKLSDEAARYVSELDDSVVALLALDAESQGTFRKGSLDKTIWSSAMTADELFGRRWLLSYEANMRGWLPNTSGDHVAADKFFKRLKDAAVSFYEPISAAKAAGQLGVVVTWVAEHSI